MNENSINWKSLEMNVDLYKSSMNVVIKLNLFHYAVTGAILSFHFSKESPTVSIVGLFLPIFLSSMLGCLLIYSAIPAMVLRNAIKKSAEELHLEIYPESIFLVMLCLIFGIAMVVVALGLIAYLLGIMHPNKQTDRILSPA